MSKPAIKHHGKDIDIVALKSPELASFQSRANGIRSMSEQVLQNRHTNEVEEVRSCHVCGQASFVPTGVAIYGLEYLQCRNCQHVFTRYRLTDAALDHYYADDKSYADIYTNPATLERRVQTVARPKFDWVHECFHAEFGRDPRMILDVGAGGGHFVQAARLAGCPAAGLEISGNSVRFAKAAFGLDLITQSFPEFAETCPDRHEFDVCTFWGVLEHVSAPMRFLDAARSFLARSAAYPHVAIVAAVPHFHSLSTTVQRVFPDNVIRHLNPVSHMQMFTLPSLNTAFDRIDYERRHFWFFGMDAYELVTQTVQSQAGAATTFTPQLQELILQLQRQIDQLEWSDEVTVFAVPAEPGSPSSAPRDRTT